ncbi:tmRNA proteolysis tag, partial [Campylobacter vicugnae]
ANNVNFAPAYAKAA